MISQLLRHLANYGGSGVLISLTGLLSFPLLTRALSIEEYGLLGLISSSVTFMVAFGKLGLQHAVVREYAELMNKDVAEQQRGFATFTMGFIFFAVMASLLWWSVGTFLIPSISENPMLPTLFIMTAFLVFVRILVSYPVNALRARQHSGVVSLFRIFNNYICLGLYVGLYLFADFTLYQVFLCIIGTETLTCIWLFYRARNVTHFRFSPVSSPYFKVILTYSVPLMAVELVSLLLNLGDRYVIEAVLGSKQLGFYAAAYNLSSYFSFIVAGSLMQALLPMYLQMWADEGEEPTRAFIEKILRYYVLFGAPIFTLFTIVSPHLLSMLASEKYLQGSVIIPWVCAGMFFNGALVLVGAGLHIKKQAKLFVRWMLLASVFNIVANLLVVPMFGLLGAAIVTLFSYIVLLAGVHRDANRLFRISVPYRALFTTSMACVAAYFIATNIEVDTAWLAFFVQPSIALVLLLSFLVIVEQDDIKSVKGQVIALLNARRGRA